MTKAPGSTAELDFFSLPVIAGLTRNDNREGDAWNPESQVVTFLQENSLFAHATIA